MSDYATIRFINQDKSYNITQFRQIHGLIKPRCINFILLDKSKSATVCLLKEFVKNFKHQSSNYAILIAINYLRIW